MRIHVLQHASFEDIGSMAQWFQSRKAIVTYTRFFENPSLPPQADLDLVVSMGGPMSVNDEAAFPWLRFEKQFVREAVEKNIPVLGICLGAQIIAGAMGARVYANSQKEIGWFPIEAIPGSGDAFRFPPKTPAFHWHGETFDLPPRSIRLAKSAACENQAFQIGKNVIGLQFHLEVMPESVCSLLDHCRDDLTPGPYVQTEAELKNVPHKRYVNIHKLMAELLSYLIGI